MTALSTDTYRNRSAVHNTIKGHANVAASTLIYGGSLVSLDGSGNAITTKATSTNCRGVALKRFDNSSGSAGDVVAEWREHELVDITSSSVTQGHINKTMYAKDDNTVVPTATTGPAVGMLKKLSGSTATVLVGAFEDTDAS